MRSASPTRVCQYRAESSGAISQASATVREGHEGPCRGPPVPGGQQVQRADARRQLHTRRQAHRRSSGRGPERGGDAPHDEGGQDQIDLPQIEGVAHRLQPQAGAHPQHDPFAAQAAPAAEEEPATASDDHDESRRRDHLPEARGDSPRQSGQRHEHQGRERRVGEVQRRERSTDMQHVVVELPGQHTGDAA